jgi:hypothetical protein
MVFLEGEFFGISCLIVPYKSGLYRGVVFQRETTVPPRKPYHMVASPLEIISYMNIIYAY